MTLPVFTVGELITSAYRLCGLKNVHQNLSTPEMGAGKTFLKGIVRSLHAEGIFAKVATTELVTFVDGTMTYTLDDNTLDVFSDAKFIDEDTAVEALTSNNETLISIMTREQWQVSGTRGATGRPNRYFPDRNGEAVVISVTPVPDSSNAKFGRFQVHRLRGDVTDANANLDFETYWVEYLENALAAKLALSNVLNLGRVSFFENRAEKKLDYAKAYGKQRPAQQFRLAHRTGWSR